MNTKWIVYGLAVSAAHGCVSSSTRSDLKRVREITRVESIHKHAALEVDPISDKEATRLLHKPLDEQRAVKVALLNNRQLRAQLREMGVARGQLLQAGLLPNPVAELELLPEQDSALELRVEYDITGAILAPVRSSVARPSLEAARYKAAGAVIQLGYLVRTQLYRTQAAEQRVKVAQRILDTYAASRDAAEALSSSGGMHLLDKETITLAFEKARLEVARLELSLLSEREALQRLLGLHGEETKWSLVELKDSVPEKLTKIDGDLEKEALVVNVSLKEKRMRLAALAQRAGYADLSGWIPDVALDVHALRSNNDAGVDRKDWRFGAGVSMTLPVFDRNQGESLQLRSEFDALLERYYGMAIDLRSKSRELRALLQSAHRRALQYTRVITPAQRRVSEQTFLQYNAMNLGVFELLQAKRQQLQVELECIDALVEYKNALAAIQALHAGYVINVGISPGKNSVETEVAKTGGH